MTAELSEGSQETLEDKGAEEEKKEVAQNKEARQKYSWSQGRVKTLTLSQNKSSYGCIASRFSGVESVASVENTQGNMV